MSTPVPYVYQPDQGPIAVPAPSDDTSSTTGPQYEGPSFEFLNVKWGSPVNGTTGGIVTWSFATFNSGNQPADVTYDFPMPSFYQDEVRAAFDAWEAVSDIDFVEVQDGSNVDIRLGIGAVDGNGSTLGVAYTSSFGGSLIRVNIILDSADYNSVGDSSELYLTVLHEIGHAIGLDHENDVSSIMSAFINTSLTGLTADDIAGAQALYGGEGGGGTVFDDFPTDSIATDGSFVVGGAQSGQIEISGDEDWFAIEVVANRLYRFDLTGNTLADTYLDLRGAQGQSLAFNDDGGPGLNSRITFTPAETGTIYLVASAFSSGTGSYTLTAVDITPPSIPGITISEGLSDSPGSIATSDVLISGDTFVGRLANGTDHDFVRIELTAGVTYTFDLQGADSGSGTLANPFFELNNSEGQLLTANNNGGVGLDSRITYTPTVSGTYYLEVTTNQVVGGTYTLVTTPDERTVLDSDVNPGMQVSEGGNDVPGSNVSDIGIDPGDTFSGSLSTPQDTDYIRVNLTARFEYSFELQGTESEQGTLSNPVFELRDKFGNVITSSEDDGSGHVLTHTASVSDHYFLSVRTTGSAGGTYRVVASQPDGPIPLIVQEGPTDAVASVSTDIDLLIGDTFEGEIGSLDDIDYVRVELTGGSRYIFDLKGEDSGNGTLEDPFLVLRDDEGTILRQNEDGGVLSASRIIFTPEDSGTYYLSAHTPAVGGGTGTYSLFTEQTVSPYPGVVVSEGDDDTPSGLLTEIEMFVDGTFVGDIGEPNDSDGVFIELTAGTSYTIDLRGSVSSLGTLTDPYLELQNADGTTLAQNDDGGAGPESRITFTPTVSGTYIVIASGFTSLNQGTYEIAVTTNSSLQTAEAVAPLEEGYSVSGTDPSDVLAHLVDTTLLGG
ncbi:MAG: matrixin family metalloprotease [Rhodospirillaceae bacterium]|nr:matrixin family metalloprotease [Rhodospirillaceae bacterium]MBT5566217.1 matrixin family metalloprotease [Rhodospirillaceae bacterium]MBT6088935.1 matrixin family metalloprotease [Rhodospirillaceae bacterium]MBT7451995.1 matrixin family metalloprotease [Rhodospirillaceae bacterium]